MIQDDGLLISKPFTPFAKSYFTNKVVFTGFRDQGVIVCLGSH